MSWIALHEHTKEKMYTRILKKQSSLIRQVYLAYTEKQGKSFDILRQKGTRWRLEQDLNGLILL